MQVSMKMLVLLVTATSAVALTVTAKDAAIKQHKQGSTPSIADCSSVCSDTCSQCLADCDPESATHDMGKCRDCLSQPQCATCAQCEMEHDKPEASSSLVEEDVDSWAIRDDDDCAEACPTKCEACAALCDPESKTHEMGKCTECLEQPECGTCAQCQMEHDRPDTSASLLEEDSDSWAENGDCEDACSHECQACGASCDPESKTHDMGKCRECLSQPGCATCAQCEMEHDKPPTGSDATLLQEEVGGDNGDDCANACPAKCRACGEVCDPESGSKDMDKCTACLSAPECATCAQCEMEQDKPATEE